MNLSALSNSSVIRQVPFFPAAAPVRAPVRQAQTQTRPVDTFTPAAATARSGTTPSTLDTVRRLDPEHNPKYLRHDGNTYCNVYTQDFMRARGVTLPRVTANATSEWLHSPAGRAAGWRPATAAEAQRVVNGGGNGLVTSTHNPHGHIAPIVQGTLTNGAPTISNAGSANFNVGPSTRSSSFRRPNTEYWVRD
jgi:hypothetical protein